jgi:hypothetical protein
LAGPPLHADHPRKDCDYCVVFHQETHVGTGVRVEEQYPWSGCDHCPLPGGWTAGRGCCHLSETVRGCRSINELDPLSVAVDRVL